MKYYILFLSFMTFNLNANWFTQHDFLDQSSLFLKSEALKESKSDVQEDINAIAENLKKSRGVCGGLTSLWLHAHVVSDDELSSSKVRDDVEHFFKMIRLVTLSNGEFNFTTEEKQEVENFIGQVRFYQDAYIQLLTSDISNILDHDPLHEIMYDTKRGYPKEVLLAAETYNKELLTKTLEKVVQPGLMIMIGVAENPLSVSYDERVLGAGHVMGIYKSMKSGDIFFYNSNGNHDKGDQRIDSIEQLTNLIWEASDDVTGFPMSIGFRNVNFRIFSYNDVSSTLSNDDILLSKERLSDLLKNRHLLNSPTKKYLDKALPTRFSRPGPKGAEVAEIYSISDLKKDILWAYSEDEKEEIFKKLERLKVPEDPSSYENQKAIERILREALKHKYSLEFIRELIENLDIDFWQYNISNHTMIKAILKYPNKDMEELADYFLSMDINEDALSPDSGGSIIRNLFLSRKASLPLIESFIHNGFKIGREDLEDLLLIINDTDEDDEDISQDKIKYLLDNKDTLPTYD